MQLKQLLFGEFWLLMTQFSTHDLLHRVGESWKYMPFKGTQQQSIGVLLLWCDDCDIMTSFGLDMYCGVPQCLNALWIFIGKIESPKHDSQQWFVYRQNNGACVTWVMCYRMLLEAWHMLTSKLFPRHRGNHPSADEAVLKVWLTSTATNNSKTSQRQMRSYDLIYTVLHFILHHQIELNKKIQFPSFPFQCVNKNVECMVLSHYNDVTMSIKTS